MADNIKEDKLHPETPPEQPIPVETGHAPTATETEQAPEKIITPEQNISVSAEQARKTKKLPPRQTKTVASVLPPRDEMAVRIEKILEEGLNDSFQRLSPIAKEEFKLKGEQTASKIRELLRAAHVKVKKIFRLIYNWLRLLPGINRFFLEQEAKIKTDKIIALKK